MILIAFLLVSKSGNEEIVVQYRQENAQANGADGIQISFINRSIILKNRCLLSFRWVLWDVTDIFRNASSVTSVQQFTC